MKTITIRLPDVEAAMLVELQKKNKRYRDLGVLIASLISVDFSKLNTQ
jgi:hypothetical protein